MEVQENKKDYILLSVYLARNPSSPLPPITIIDDEIAMQVYSDRVTVTVSDYVYYKSRNLTTLNSKMIEQYGGKTYKTYTLRNGEVILPGTNCWTFEPYMFRVLDISHTNLLDKLRGL